MEDTEKRFDHHAVPLSGIFWSFFKIGAFTFGGGWAMIPLIRKELVSNKKWLDDSEFVDVLAIAQSGPGPIAVNTATVTGLKMRGLPGAFAAVLGSTLPSFLVIFALATVLVRFRNSGVLEAIFTGMRPAIFGLLVSATWQVGKKSLKKPKRHSVCSGGCGLGVLHEDQPYLRGIGFWSVWSFDPERPKTVCRTFG
jgi:chromate transporter